MISRLLQQKKSCSLKKFRNSVVMRDTRNALSIVLDSNPDVLHDSCPFWAWVSLLHGHKEGVTWPLCHSQLMGIVNRVA